jgi:hypothetical protein
MLASGASALIARPMLITLCSRIAKLSNNMIQKGLAFGRDWSRSVVNSGRQGRSEILAPPAGWPRWGFGGAASTPF